MYLNVEQLQGNTEVHSRLTVTLDVFKFPMYLSKHSLTF